MPQECHAHSSSIVAQAAGLAVSPLSKRQGDAVPTKISDEKLMGLLNSSSKSAYFDLLVCRYQNKLYNLAFGLLRDSSDAEEIVQETFMRVWRNRKNFRDESNFSGWIFTITQNLCKDIWRARERKKSYENIFANHLSVHESEDYKQGKDIGVNYLATNYNSPSREAENKELKNFVKEHLQRLPERQREVVELRDFQGQPYQKIADMLGISIGTVRSRLYYARRKLRKLIK